MPTGTRGMHHLHKRKIEKIAAIELPHANKFKQVLDKLVYFGGAFAVLMTIPQVTSIWVQQNASGVSLITWCAFLCNAIIWTLYGFMHNERPIMLMYGAYFFLDISIITGIIIYG